MNNLGNAASKANKIQEALSKASKLNNISLQKDVAANINEALNNLHMNGVFAPPYGDVWIKTLQIRRTSSAYISARDFFLEPSAGAGGCFTIRLI